MIGVADVNLAASAHAVEGDKSDARRKKERERRFEQMKQRARSLKLTLPSAKDQSSLGLVKEPLLRYTDSARNTADGSLWALGDNGRPLAVLALFYVPKGTTNAAWVFECVSLTERPISVSRSTGWRWTPQSTDFKLSRFRDAPSKSEGQIVRLRLMKSLSRRFTASERIDNSKDYQLRLLPQPIHRYAQLGAGLLDGAIFVFAYGTNPEILLFIEQHRTESHAASWHYGFARLSTAELRVRLMDHVVWDQPEVSKWTENDAYSSSVERIVLSAPGTSDG